MPLFRQYHRKAINIKGKKKLGKKTKYILSGAIIMLSVLLVLFFVFFINNKIDTTKFNEYLDEGNFEKAYKAYSKAETEYQETFENYLDKFINNYNNSLITYDETLLIIAKLTNRGFAGKSVDDCKEKIRILHASKEVYSAATTLFDNNNIIRAQEYYTEVIELDTNYSDANDKIIAIDENINAYAFADSLYSSNKTEEAYKAYKSIIETGVNIENAEYKVSTIDSVNASWEEEFKDGTYSKCTYPYEAPVKDDSIYLPHSYKGLHSIVKHNLSDELTEVFVIAEMPGSFIINDINIVGEYIYFIAGENVGTGKMISNPYNIYRMKDDGTDLECVMMGDFKDLIVYKDGFYISSYSKGILKLDRNFKVLEHIYEEVPVQMQLVYDKLYFTADSHNPYKMDNSQYVYDGKELTHTKQKNRLRFGFYNNTELYTYRVGSFYYEKLFIVNEDKNKNYMLKFDNIKFLYGLIGDNIVYTKEEIKGQVKYYLLNPENSEHKDFTDRLPDNILNLEKVSYDHEMLVFSTNKGFLITDSQYNSINTIDLSQKCIESKSMNHQIDYSHNEFYTNDEIVLTEKCFWYYSNDELNIKIEERYIDNVDTNIYVAHIRTTNPSLMQIDCPAGDTHLTKIRKYPTKLARQYSAVFACNGDFFDQNAWTGISIRDGIVYKENLLKNMMAIYPDGSLICYSNEDSVTYEDLINDGVKNTLSFGPILLSDSEYGNDIYTNLLSHPNPRNGIGMIEPGHYVVILADGRQPRSAGLSLKSMADLFKEEGCVEAYNLDGGQSATMMFMGEFVNTHINDYEGIFFRALPEIIYWGTSDLVPEEK